MSKSPVHALSAGVIPVRFVDGEPRYLLLRAYRYWDFPKGELEPGESPLSAALREVREETGLQGPVFRWGRGFHQTAPYARGKVARYYVAEYPEGAVRFGTNTRLGRPEHHEFRWCRVREARRLLGGRVSAALEWAAARLAAGPPPPDPG